MNEKTMQSTLDNLAELVCKQCEQYDNWLLYYYRARGEGLSDVQAAEVAYKNCEAE